MAHEYWIYQIPLWVVSLLFLTVLLIPMEIGFRLGKRRSRNHLKPEEEIRSDVTLAAMLALLGLILAFTYSFSMSRADLRKNSFLLEVNALGTAFLRADLLPEPGRTEVRQRLYEYAKSCHIVSGSISTLKDLKQHVKNSEELQSKLWPAVKSAIRLPGDMTAPERALLTASINEVIDAHTSRMMFFYDRLPSAVLLLLLLIAGTALGIAAYNSGLSGHQLRWRMTGFALILALLIYLILDFDMMLRGFIQLDLSILEQLIDEMEEALVDHRHPN